MNRIAPYLIVAAVAAASATDAAEHTPYTRKVAIVVYENAEPLDWTGPFEVYNNAGRFGSAHGEPAFDVYVVGKTGQAVDSQGLKVVPSYSIENAPRPDIVVFPGGPASQIYDDPVFFAWASQAAKRAEIAQSVCTGAFVLGRAGMLDGLDATTHYGSIDGLRQRFPAARVHDGRRYVDNGQVVTTAGISAGIDGSLHVVARLLGRRIADQVASYMEYHWTPEPYLAGGYAYRNPSTDDAGRRVQDAELLHEQKSYAEAAAVYRELLAATPGDRALWGGLGTTLRALGDHAGAGAALSRSVEGLSGAHAAWVLFSAARELASAGRRDAAVAALQQAFASGYSDREAIDRDPVFAGLRSDPRLVQPAGR